MKIKRISCFESNSSSTHSVTIETKGSGSGRGDKVKPLVDEQGRLVPQNLSSHTKYVGEASFTLCGTKDEKAAITVDWLSCRLDEGEVTEETVDKAVGILAKKCGYTGVDKNQKKYSYSFYPSTEYCGAGDDDYLEDLKGEDEETVDFTSFEKFIDDVILDDTKEIVDMDTPN